MGCFLAHVRKPCARERLSYAANLWTRMVGSMRNPRAQQPLFAQASPNFPALVLPLGGRTAFRTAFVTPGDTITFPRPAHLGRFASEAPRYRQGFSMPMYSPELP